MNSNSKTTSAKTVCRFAPSPTGFLHVGNIRAAIINFLYAQKTGGEFILRLDDTDEKRVKDEYRNAIIEDMAWIGLKYDHLVKQSDRLERYKQAKERLINSGRLYECFESAEELNLQRKLQNAQGLRPIYNRASLNLTEEQKRHYREQGLQPYYRFLLEDKIVAWQDKVKGQISFPGQHFSDPVLVRENDVPTYTFCSVVDDIEMNVTDIIRGEDHITNTAIQIQIMEALGATPPAFSHLALVKATDKKISKREGGFDIRSLRNDGFEAMALVNLLAQIGSSGSLNIYKNFDELLTNFDLSNFSKSSTTYDIAELGNINHKFLQIADFANIVPKLKKLDPTTDIDQKFWDNIKPNLNMAQEAIFWWKICKENFRHSHNTNDQEFLNIAKSVLPEDTSNSDSWQQWINNIKTKSDRKGAALFMPLRLALTGQEHGPELKNILPLINRDEILARL